MVIAVQCYGNNNNLNVTYGTANDNMEQKRSVNWFEHKVKWKMEKFVLTKWKFQSRNQLNDTINSD